MNKQEIYGGGFEEAKKLGMQLAQPLLVPYHFIRCICIFERIHSYCIEKNICESLL